MALTLLQQVRLLVQDNTPGLYFLADEEINFLLDKNYSNVNRASLEAAKIILLNLSMRGDSTVDVLSIRRSSAAEQYRKSLVLFINSPELNPMFQNVSMYAGGISLGDMQLNTANADNNFVSPPDNLQSSVEYSSGYFTL